MSTYTTNTGVVVECVQGNIAQQTDIDAVVNAANAELRSGGGVAGAIHRAAGPELYEECKALAPIRPGDAVITAAGMLPNKYVIHCLGPVYGVDEPSPTLLSACYHNALLRAEEAEARSIAFPAISTGVFGYPMHEAAGVAFAALAEELPRLRSLKRIRFVLFGEQDLKIHKQALAEQFLD